MQLAIMGQDCPAGIGQVPAMNIPPEEKARLPPFFGNWLVFRLDGSACKTGEESGFRLVAWGELDQLQGTQDGYGDIRDSG